RMTRAHDHVLGALVLARLVALGERAPRADRISLGPGAPLAAAMRMIDRIHRHAAHRRPYAAPAHGARLADLAQVMLLVAHFADGRAAVYVNLADFPGAQPQLGVGSFARKELHRRASGAGELRAAPGLHFDTVDRGADRDVSQRKRVADLYRGIGAALQLLSHAEAFGRDDVTAFAVRIAEQGDVRAAVRIVFQPFHARGDSVLVAPEIDEPVKALVPAALVPGGDVAVTVAAGLADLFFDQRLHRPAFPQLGIDDLHHPAPSSRSRFELDESHLLRLPCCEVDLLARLQAHEGFLPVVAAADKAAEALFLAPDIRHLHALDLDLEHQLDGRLDLRFGGVRCDPKDHLRVLVGDEGALLGHHGREQHLHQALL